jgi:hypothetical protein
MKHFKTKERREGTRYEDINQSNLYGGCGFAAGFLFKHGASIALRADPFNRSRFDSAADGCAIPNSNGIANHQTIAYAAAFAHAY